MTWNIRGHAAGKNPSHIEEIARVIDAARADVVCLQEIHCRTHRSAADQAEELSNLTGLDSAFGRSCSVRGGDYGNALLTRGAILESEVIPLPGGGEPRSVLRGDLRFDGTTITIHVTHLSAWGRLRRRSRLAQIVRLGEVVATSTLPTVLAGDMNVPPHAAEIRALEACTSLTPAGDLSEPTYPRTRQRLDYVFCDSRWEVLGAEVVRGGPSDHWLALVDLSLEAA